MKKLLTLAFCALLGSLMWAASPVNSHANPFQDDLSRLDDEFAGITQLEQLVEERHATYSELAAEYNTLLQNVNNDTDIFTSIFGTGSPDDDKLLGISGFLWGFCTGLLGIGILGVILVYVAVEGDAKKREGKKAIIGCVIGSLLPVIIWLGFFAASAWWAY
jgi:hypothetical protein